MEIIRPHKPAELGSIPTITIRPFSAGSVGGVLADSRLGDFSRRRLVAMTASLHGAYERGFESLRLHLAFVGEPSVDPDASEASALKHPGPNPGEGTKICLCGD